MRSSLLTFTAVLILLIIHDIRAIDWIDYDESSSNMDTVFDDDSNQYLSALTRDNEQEIYSPIITGFKYVSGGAGEGRQHLSPSGEISNRPEVKSDEELPSYCHPPNPCPLGVEADDCDASPMSSFTGDYSQLYQSSQNCQCDKDHDKCSANNLLNLDQSTISASNGNLKRSRRIGRDVRSTQQAENTSKNNLHRNSFHQGESLRFHVAKKSPNSVTF